MAGLENGNLIVDADPDPDVPDDAAAAAAGDLVEFESQPFARRPDEPERWYEIFWRYCQLGPFRTLNGVANAIRAEQGRPPRHTLPNRWSQVARAWDWRSRARAFDEWERRQTAAARAQQIRAMEERHILEFKALQSKALERLKQIDIGQLSPRDVLRFITEAVKGERIAMGAAGSVTESRHTGPDGETPIQVIEIVRAGPQAGAAAQVHVEATGEIMDAEFQPKPTPDSGQVRPLSPPTPLEFDL